MPFHPGVAATLCSHLRCILVLVKDMLCNCTHVRFQEKPDSAVGTEIRTVRPWDIAWWESEGRFGVMDVL